MPGARFALDLSTATPNEVYWGDFGVLPRRVEARVAPIAWADVGLDFGWLDAGAELRFGLPASPERSLAGNLALGGRSGKLGLFDDTRDTWSLYARLEAYPELHSSVKRPNARGHVARTTGRLVSALGLDTGAFYRGESYDQSDDAESFGPPEQHRVDRELRLEAAAGYHLMLPRHSDKQMLWIQATVQPYAVLHKAKPSGHTWGMVVVLTGGLYVVFLDPDAH